MQGKVAFATPCAPILGITPAHAGKSEVHCTPDNFTWDHPRACGEKPMRILWKHAKEGSPPRMRGKVKKNLLKKQYIRITPAHAGKSAFLLVDRDAAEDHPRACGEKNQIWCCDVPTLGSPPRMRGKVSIQRTLESALRITPAHAGKSGKHPETL